MDCMRMAGLHACKDQSRLLDLGVQNLPGQPRFSSLKPQAEIFDLEQPVYLKAGGRGFLLVEVLRPL
jgi:hypothetical protein